MARQNIDTLAALRKPPGRIYRKEGGQGSSNTGSVREKWKFLWESKLGERWQRANSVRKQRRLGTEPYSGRMIMYLRVSSQTLTTTTAPGDTTDHGKRQTPFVQAGMSEINEWATRATRDCGIVALILLFENIQWHWIHMLDTKITFLRQIQFTTLTIGYCLNISFARFSDM